MDDSDIVGQLEATPVTVIRVEPDAQPLERFAARELQRYVKLLFDEDAAIDSQAKNAQYVFDVRVCTDGLSEQGIRLAPDGHTLHVQGGSVQVTLWAVYELVQRWGVRYLLDRDVLPESPGEPRFPVTETVTIEPMLRVRQWRVVNCLAIGPESWGIADYRVLLDQLAKLKFNRILISTWPYQPFLPLKVGGIKRTSGTLWFDYRYPITDDMPGRWLFGAEEKEFWNPDFPPREAGYEALAAAGETHLNAIMDYALERGIESVIAAHLLDFPPEFAPLLPDSQPVQQLNTLTIVPGPSVTHDDKGLAMLARAVLQTTINTYPQAVAVQISMSEFRQWTHLYPQAWHALSVAHNIDRISSLDELLDAASQRSHFDGNRARREVCGDLVFLWFLDRLLSDPQLLASTRRPDVRIILAGVAEELFSLMSAIAPPNSELLNHIDYTAARVVRRRKALDRLPDDAPDSLLVFTLHDDNVGCLPALSSGPLHELMKDLRRHRWAGYSTRYWLNNDHDAVVQYIARGAWDETAAPQSVSRDLVLAICGQACVNDMLIVFEQVESASLHLAEHDAGFGFPIPGMMTKHLVPAPTPQWLLNCQTAYQRGLDAARAAREKCGDIGKWFVDYWIGRLTFAIGYIDCVDLMHQLARAEAQLAEAVNDDATHSARCLAQQHAQQAVQRARDMLDAYAKVARNRSDRGAVAVMGEYIYRPLKEKAEMFNAP